MTGVKRRGAVPLPNSQDGFTLLEVLIAFLIGSIALAVLFQAAADSQTASIVAAQYQEALSRARSRLAAIDAAGPMTAGDRQGDDGGGFRWRVRVAPLQSGTGTTPTPMLYVVSVAVSWGSAGPERTVRLESRRVGLAPPAAP